MLSQEALNALNGIIKFLLSKGCGGGLIGAFLILAASYFIDVGIPIKNASWMKKILFLFAGAVLGALFHHTKKVDMLTCAMLGAGWPYVALSLKKGAEAFSKGKALRRLGGAAMKELIEMVQEKLGSEEGGGNSATP